MGICIGIHCGRGLAASRDSLRAGTHCGRGIGAGGDSPCRIGAGGDSQATNHPKQARATTGNQ